MTEELKPCERCGSSIFVGDECQGCYTSREDVGLRARLTALMESMEARLANIEGNGLMAMTERGCLEKCITELREALQ